MQQPKVALTFWWDPLGYQIRIEGKVERTSEAESDAYFESRPRGSQIGAWASEQSAEIDGPEVLHQAVRRLKEKYADQPVPRPPHWGGYRVVPLTIEFWISRDDRLHDRLRYRKLASGEWVIKHLAP